MFRILCFEFLMMIPYFYYPTINLGLITINTWGLFAAIGFGLAIYIAWRHAQCRGQNPNIILDLSFWIILASIVGARFFHVFLYDWNFYRENLNEIWKIWHGGLSSFGGFAGAAIVGLIYLWEKRIDLLDYSDTFIFALPAGLACGRIGCFLIHDHPGTLTNFILGVKYPDETRHDLGLYLGIFDIILFTVFYIFEKTHLGRVIFRGTPPKGFYIAAFTLIYGLARFFLDFLRAYDLPGSDARYGGLTPAQYGSIFLFGFGLFLTFRLKKLKTV